MILIKAVAAYMALKSISQNDMTYKDAYKAAKLKARLEHEYNFYLAEEEKIIAQYADRDGEGKIISDDNGRIKLSPGKEKEYQARINELSRTETDEYTPIIISAPKKIKPVELEALAGLVEFTEDEDE